MALITPGATPEEAAAVIAALERFSRDNAAGEATGQRAGGPLILPWKRAALAEGMDRQPGPEN